MNVLFDIINNSIIIMNEKLYTHIVKISFAFSSPVIIIAIERIDAIKERIFDVIIETNVSPTTCFSISLSQSSFPTKIAAKPNNTVNTNANTVVKTPASVSSIILPNPNVIMTGEYPKVCVNLQTDVR